MKSKIVVLIYILICTCSISNSYLAATAPSEPQTEFEQLVVIQDKYGNNPEDTQTLHYAILQNDHAAIDLLFKYGASPCYDCLFYAVKAGNLDFVKYLIEIGVNLNRGNSKKFYLYTAINEYQNAIASHLINYDIELTPPQVQNCFYECAVVGNLEIFNLLMSKGYDLKERAEFFGQLLNMATQKYVQQKIEMITNLLDQHIVDPNEFTEDGHSPIFFFAAYGGIHPYRTELLKLFLERGANPKAFDKNGSNVLLLLVGESDKYFNDQKEAIQLLVDYGADLNHKDSRGNTPLKLARGSRMLPFLKSLGAE